eukprot:1107427-Heterocapsa_arctica.AAC.1
MTPQPRATQNGHAGGRKHHQLQSVARRNGATRGLLCMSTKHSSPTPPTSDQIYTEPSTASRTP